MVKIEIRFGKGVQSSHGTQKAPSGETHGRSAAPRSAGGRVSDTRHPRDEHWAPNQQRHTSATAGIDSHRNPPNSRRSSSTQDYITSSPGEPCSTPRSRSSKNQEHQGSNDPLQKRPPTDLIALIVIRVNPMVNKKQVPIKFCSKSESTLADTYGAIGAKDRQRINTCIATGILKQRGDEYQSQIFKLWEFEIYLSYPADNTPDRAIKLLEYISAGTEGWSIWQFSSLPKEARQNSHDILSHMISIWLSGQSLINESIFFAKDMEDTTLYAAMYFILSCLNTDGAKDFNQDKKVSCQSSSHENNIVSTVLEEILAIVFRSNFTTYECE